MKTYTIRPRTPRSWDILCDGATVGTVTVSNLQVGHDDTMHTAPATTYHATIGTSSAVGTSPHGAAMAAARGLR